MSSLSWYKPEALEGIQSHRMPRVWSKALFRQHAQPRQVHKRFRTATFGLAAHLGFCAQGGPQDMLDPFISL